MNVDKKLKKLGFSKVSESTRSCHYERYNAEHDFYHTVYISYRTAWGEFKIQSYDEQLIDKKGIGNTNVALSIPEMKLFLKKMKKMQRAYVRWRGWF